MECVCSGGNMCNWGASFIEDVSPVEFMHLATGAHPFIEDVSPVEFMHLATGAHPLLRMYLRWSLCTLYLLAYQVRATVGDSGLCVLFAFRLLRAN